MSKLVQLREELDAKRKALAEVFADAKKDDGTYDFTAVKSLEGDMSGRVETVRAKNREIEDLAKQVADLVDIDNMAGANAKSLDDSTRAAMHAAPAAKAAGFQVVKSLGEYIVGSGALQAKGMQKSFELPEGVGVKTLMETSAGWAPEAIRSGKVVESAQRPVQVLDLIPSTTTNQNAVVYMLESTFTNNAAEAAEGAAYGESAFALTETSSPVQKVAVSLPVTDEQLEDVSQIQAYINNRLTFQLRQRLDSQVLVGNGTSPNISGILDRSGLQTQAKGADPTPDAIYKALTKVRVTGRAVPNAVVLHGNDWQEIRLLRTSDGIYIWGSPAESGPAMIWGLPVALSEALTEGTGLVGDFATHCQLSIRRNVTVKVSDSHSDYFTKGKQAIRADMRASLEVFREAAFCSVTGI